MNKPHKWAEVIKAWADGKEIQYHLINAGSGWLDYKQAIDGAPMFDIGHYEWRVKPEVKRYRAAKMMDCYGKAYLICVDDQSLSEPPDHNMDFVSWLTDWVEYE